MTDVTYRIWIVRNGLHISVEACCSRFANDEFIHYEDGKWIVFDDGPGSIILDDIRFCPFCGKELIFPETA